MPLSDFVDASSPKATSTPKTSRPNKPSPDKEAKRKLAQKAWLLARYADPKLSAKELLQLPHGAAGGTRHGFNKDGIKARYRLLSLLLHPDKNRGSGQEAEFEAAFKRLQQAEEELTAAAERAHAGRGTRGTRPSQSESAGSSPTASPPGAGTKGNSASPQPPTPAEAAQRVEEASGAAPGAPRKKFGLKVTVTFKKRNGRQFPKLTVSQRRAHARHIVRMAHTHHPSIDRPQTEPPLSTLFSASVERGEDPRYNQSYHVQAYQRWYTAGDAATAVDACTAYYLALDYSEAGLLTCVFILVLDEEEQSEDDAFEYTTKQEGKPHYFNAMGGSDFDPKEREAWKEAYRAKHSNVNSTGFKKANFASTADKGRLGGRGTSCRSG